MGGEIGVESQEGVGATFWFTSVFEKLSDSPVTVEDKEIPSIICDTEKKHIKILVAEDNFINQTVILRILEKYGYHACAVCNGKEVIEVLEKIPYNLIIMDLEMPGMSGFEASEIIREKEKVTGKHIPIIALTAHAVKDYKDRCIIAGMDDYILKPFQPYVLIKTIEKYIKKETLIKPLETYLRKDERNQIFDRDDLLTRVDGDEKIIEPLIKHFLKEIPDLIKELNMSLTDKDFPGISRQSHSIKGVASNMGARKISRAAIELEHAAKNKNLEMSCLYLKNLEEEFKLFRSVVF
jgi:CheY-like chemotaxis protein